MASDDLDMGATIKGFSAGQKVFGRYTLKAILGRGGMGVVWLARDEELERDIALKFLPEIVALDPEAVADLKRETRRNLDLTHPHIVRIYDFVTDARAAAISMEYVDGATLTSLKVERSDRVFTVEELRPWLTQLAEALHYAHTRAKIVHRDLKPANLMITKAGELKVTDFGIARNISDSVSRVSAQAGSSGTPVYMSPQQMMGDKPAVADDVYAFGAMLFELLTSKPPFHSGNVILQVQSKKPPTLAERRAELGINRGPVPAEWEATVAACLSKEPADRPGSIREAAARLGLIEGGAPPEVPPTVEPGAASPPEEPPAAAVPAGGGRRVPIAVLATIGGLALVTLGVAGWWFGVYRPGREKAAAAAEWERKRTEGAFAVAAVTPSGDGISDRVILGRGFMPEDFRAGAPAVAVMRDAAWEGALKLDPAVIGHELELAGGRRVTIVGVVADDSATAPDLWIARPEGAGGGPVSGALAGALAALPGSGRPWENSLGMRFVPVAGSPVLFSVWETRVQDFSEFARATGLDWVRPEFAQGPTHPAVRVSWNQAQAFCAWLTERERAAGRLGPRQRYRLPTDLEWSSAVGLPPEQATFPGARHGGFEGVYPWGGPPAEVWPPTAKHGNFCDLSYRREVDPNAAIIPDYDDGFAHTAPVGSFAASAAGLHDLSGNVWEWVEDRVDPDFDDRTLRGGTYAYHGFYVNFYLQSSYRHALAPHAAEADVGFRTVLDLDGVVDPVPVPAAAEGAAWSVDDRRRIAAWFPGAWGTKSGLREIILSPGQGDRLKPGEQFRVHYEGRLLDGTVFDSSRARGQPGRFTVGRGELIAGWEEALPKMQRGERRLIIIPPWLGYGERGRPPAIPGGATLVYDLEVLPD